MAFDWMGLVPGIAGAIEGRSSANKMNQLALQAQAMQPAFNLTPQQRQALAGGMYSGAMQTGQQYASQMAPWVQQQDDAYLNRLMKQAAATHVNRFAAGGGESGPSGPTAVQLGNMADQVRSRNAQNMVGLLQQGEAQRQNYMNMLNNSANSAMSGIGMGMEAERYGGMPISGALQGLYQSYRSGQRPGTYSQPQQQYANADTRTTVRNQQTYGPRNNPAFVGPYSSGYYNEETSK